MSDRPKDGGILVESDDLSRCSNYESATKGSDGEVECADHDGDHSDYGDEGRRDFQPLDSADEEHVDENDEENDSDSVIVEDEREDGDGQESLPAKEKKLDDDEDRRNPQYIPKKGTFYEHDDRTADDGDSGEKREGKEGAKDREGKEPGKESSGRKIWKEKEDRWKHDRFQETEQMPKSREELLQVYGYDIRSEETPPKARRRRRYGRGPNKYTRSWEDEAAYGRPLSAFIVEKEGAGDGVGVGRATTATGRRKGLPSRTPDANKGRPPRRDRPRQDFPALSPPANNAPAENGQKTKAETTATTFSSKVGDNRVTGSFKMNPRDVIPPFRNQQTASSNNQSQETRPVDKGNVAASQQLAAQPHSNKSEDGSKRSWRREEDESRRQGSGRIEGRPRPQSGGVRRRSVDWQDLNGQSRGRGRPGRVGEAGRITKPGENGHQSDGGSHNYVEDVRKDLGSLQITNSQHQQSIHQGNTPSGGDFARRQSSSGSGSNGGSNGPASNNSNYRQSVVPPRMQESAGSRPKRYSSVRPRNMPEAGPGPVQGQGQIQCPPSGPVTAAGPGAVPGPVSSQVSGPVASPVPGAVPVVGAGTGATPPPPPVTSPYTAPAHSYYQPGYPQPIYADTTGQQPVPNQVVVEASSAAQMLVRPPQAVAGGLAPPPGAMAPPPFPAGFPQPPPSYMNPPPGPAGRLLPGAGFMAPATAPPPQPINFVAAPNAQGQFQSLAFQTYQPIAMVGQVNQPQPQEMYQRQSGITYYSPQNQAVPRAVPQPRVKAAIPIVPPPELASRHRDEMEVSGEHDPASLRHSPSPGHVSVGALVGVPLEANCQPMCPSPTLAPAKSPSPSGAPLHRNNEDVLVTVESLIGSNPLAMNPNSVPAEPSPDKATQEQPSETSEEPAV